MPELPEVETARRGLEPLLTGRRIEAVVIREPRLRWPVPAIIASALPGAMVHGVGRRAKYLLVAVDGGTLILHLGMSGSLRVVPADTPAGKHDHVDVVLDDGRALRLRDPRRFGAVLWTDEDPQAHPRLRDLGPEPLGNTFSGAWLDERARGRRCPVKAFIMDGRVVVGVGNIYASEALHRARIHPARAAGRVAAARYERLARCVRDVLRDAIAEGGTTLRDFVNEGGNPGYFARELLVYGRSGETCPTCRVATIRKCTLGQRSSFYCPSCQR